MQSDRCSNGVCWWVGGRRERGAGGGARQPAGAPRASSAILAARTSRAARQTCSRRIPRASESLSCCWPVLWTVVTDSWTDGGARGRRRPARAGTGARRRGCGVSWACLCTSGCFTKTFTQAVHKLTPVAVAGDHLGHSRRCCRKGSQITNCKTINLIHSLSLLFIFDLVHFNQCTIISKVAWFRIYDTYTYIEKKKNIWLYDFIFLKTSPFHNFNFVINISYHQYTPWYH